MSGYFQTASYLDLQKRTDYSPQEIALILKGQDYNFDRDVAVVLDKIKDLKTKEPYTSLLQKIITYLNAAVKQDLDIQRKRKFSYLIASVDELFYLCRKNKSLEADNRYFDTASAVFLKLLSENAKVLNMRNCAFVVEKASYFISCKEYQHVKRTINNADKTDKIKCSQIIRNMSLDAILNLMYLSHDPILENKVLELLYDNDLKVRANVYSALHYFFKKNEEIFWDKLKQSLFLEKDDYCLSIIILNLCFNDAAVKNPSAGQMICRELFSRFEKSKHEISTEVWNAFSEFLLLRLIRHGQKEVLDDLRRLILRDEFRVTILYRLFELFNNLVVFSAVFLNSSGTLFYVLRMIIENKLILVQSLKDDERDRIGAISFILTEICFKELACAEKDKYFQILEFHYAEILSLFDYCFKIISKKKEFLPTATIVDIFGLLKDLVKVNPAASLDLAQRIIADIFIDLRNDAIAVVEFDNVCIAYIKTFPSGMIRSEIIKKTSELLNQSINSGSGKAAYLLSRLEEL